MALMSSGYTSDIFTSSSPVLQPVKGMGGGSCAEMLWGSAGCSRHSPQTLRCAQREAQHPHPPQPLTFQRAQPAGEPPLELDVELGDPDGAGEIQGDPLARALEAEMVPRTGYGGGQRAVRSSGPPPTLHPPPSSCPYLVRVPARLLVGVKHVLLPELLHVAVQHRAYPAGGGGGSGTVPGSAATTPVPVPPRGPGLTAWRCQRRPTAPPASLRATDLDGNRDIAEHGSTRNPPEKHLSSVREPEK